MRRANGTGTITKLSGRRRKPYIAKYRVGTNEDGNRRYVIVGYFASKESASDALSRFSYDPDPATVSNMTFAEGFERFKENIAPNVTETTLKTYKNAFKKCAEIHNKPLRKLKTLHYQSVIDNCGLKSKSARLLLKSIMCQVCNYAVQNDIVPKNYARFVVINGTPVKEKVIYSDEEIELLFADGSKAAKQLLMLIYSGFRIGEFSLLRKADVDLENRVIVGGGKTKAGTGRTVPIHSKVYKFWEETVNGAKDLLFPGKNECVRDITLWRYHFKRLHERLGIPYRSAHAARHTCASIMARDGVNPLYIKEILGHTKYSFTVDRYTHVDPKVLTDEIDKMR